MCVMLMIAACTSSEGNAPPARSPEGAARRYLAAVASHDGAAALSVLEPKFRSHPFALDPHSLGYTGHAEVTGSLLVTRNIWTVGTSLVSADGRSPGPTFSVVRTHSGSYLIAGYVVHG